ncbi:MAG: UDP-N-acetylmuramoyl-L-alanyl-D-glutamate--2,6-diaminopimelate ligase [Phycisphaerales bacterium]|nr:MAG: UDP-N-acetylmuramoyl-L-alanyl-D-glutamate--2,6-diaminopimelate ligase [Phycisphaerales bacterium]
MLGFGGLWCAGGGAVDMLSGGVPSPAGCREGQTVRLGELISGLGVRLVSGDVGVRVCDLTEDSRTVVPGSLFVARAGLVDDGASYIAEAIEGGAAAVLIGAEAGGAHARGPWPIALCVAPEPQLAGALLAERFYGQPSSKLGVVGVTGTNGKTTVTHLVRQLMRSGGVRCGLIGGVEVDDGVGVAPAVLTTPPAIELSRTLAIMVEAGCRAAAVEVSSHGLTQHRASGVRFRVGVFTNLSGDHQDYHGSMAAYAGAKAELFERLEPGALAVVNADDEACARMVRDCRARVLRCTASDAPELPGVRTASVRVLSEGLEGLRVRLAGPWGVVTARTPLVGAHNAMNLLQACCAAHELGLHAEDLAVALPRLRPAAGRLERVCVPGATGEGGPLVFVDFAHTDDALRRTLASVRTGMASRSPSVGGPSRLWVVFGCGGDRDRSKRPRMGAAAAELADEVVVTSDNPRTEQPGAIIDAVLSGMPADARARAHVHADRERAIEHAVRSAGACDVVVIAGKGHERTQILPDGRGGVTHRPFDDRAVAREVLAARAKGVKSAAPDAARARAT